MVLIGGDPGIGKSTLLVQALLLLAERLPALYVSGEKSAKQISLRAQRLGLPIHCLRLLTETLHLAPGSVAQVCESAARLVHFVKQTGTSVFLVGHVTKEGALTEPRVLEHMVGTVLYFEGERR